MQRNSIAFKHSWTYDISLCSHRRTILQQQGLSAITDTDIAAFSLNLVTPQNCAVSTLNIPTTGTMKTPIVATNVSSHNTVTSRSPDRLLLPQHAPTSVTVSRISSTSASGNELSIPALSFDITSINPQGINTHSFTSESLPLHATVNHKIKEKIWSIEFVDVLSRH